ncbi:MAG: RNA polymerase sigma factor [Clostridia bacterium]|nr:RNA polymerase sigma factor [Clostridia bacterium]
MTDKRMVVRARDGDSKTREALYKKYYGDVYRYCVYRVGSLYDAEDLTQDAFLRFYRYSDADIKNVKAYILKIASNVCSDHLAGRRDSIELDESIPADAEPLNDSQQEVRRAIAALTDEQRQVVILYYYNGLRLARIAEILDVPLSTVKTRLSRARLKLKQLLIQAGF